MATWLFSWAVLAGLGSSAQAEVDAYKSLSLAELMELEVISLSRTPQKLSDAPSAIQVLTGEEIYRSGATNLAEALRLAPNLQVARVNSSRWAISARGFNNVLANKLLVMIDGRTVYTPLYAGVFWDVQNTLLRDVDRIEIVSGPGGTLWGANAVNGVINIITKSARETQGLYVEAAAGDELRRHGAVRYGGSLGRTLHFRVYGMGTERDDTRLSDGSDARDDWNAGQGGFRLDWEPQDSDRFTFQGDIYRSRPNAGTGATGEPAEGKGGNLLGRWAHAFTPDSELVFQWYYDRGYRDFRNGLTETLSTWDFDGQHRFQVGERHEVMWGAGFRSMDHEVTNLPAIGFLPERRKLHLYSVFAQDTMELVADRLSFTFGAKLEHNDYTGLEVQPNVRLAWTPTARQAYWAAVSRAVRTPARLDRELYLNSSAATPLLRPSPGYDSETVVAAEAGWRVQATDTFSASFSFFHNEYDELRSVEPAVPPATPPFTLDNGVEGYTHGVEVAGTWQATEWWRLRGGYTFLRKHLRVKPGEIDLNEADAGSNDPEHQFVLQSLMDLPRGVSLDVALRYVGELPDPFVSDYFGLDVRVAWRPKERLELSLVGRSLLEPSHVEFGSSSPGPREIERGVYGKAAWWF